MFNCIKADTGPDYDPVLLSLYTDRYSLSVQSNFPGQTVGCAVSIP